MTFTIVGEEIVVGHRLEELKVLLTAIARGHLLHNILQKGIVDDLAQGELTVQVRTTQQTNRAST